MDAMLNKTPSTEIRRMGGLRRAVSLKSACATLANDEWYAEAARIDKRLPMPRSGFDWSVHGQLLADDVASGSVPLDPERDLNPKALVQGKGFGSSGWYFSGDDVGSAMSSPETITTQLAVGDEYRQGYFVVELPTEDAVRFGAAKPTSLDLTNSIEGDLNRNAEPFGRTKPTAPGQPPAREVVLPPVPVSAMSKVTFVRGGRR
jgi:hypothetical protein